MGKYVAHESSHLIRNVINGARTALFSGRSLTRYHCSYDQVVWLVGFNVLLAAVTGYLSSFPAPRFSIYGLYVDMVSLGSVLLAVYIITKIMRDEAVNLRLLVIIYSVAPVFLVIGKALDAAGPTSDWNTALGWSLLVWSLAVVYFVLFNLGAHEVGKAVKSFTVYFVLVFLTALFLPKWEFWYQSSDDSSGAEYAKLRNERFLYLQYDLLDEVDHGLLAGTRDQIDVYFVGFAGYSSEDVFMKEVTYGRDLFEDRFNARGRTVSLINNVKTAETTPLATKTNLALALKAIGAKMNPEEDFLFLYMTSHGSEKHRLSVTMWPYSLEQISPDGLRTLLDEAGIKNRVLMISACYSGGFVKPLMDDNTLVITAAAAQRKSFGCGSESEFTYFGKALLADHLKRNTPLLDAFNNALGSIHEREQREGKRFSRPQLFIGPAMADKLHALDEALASSRVAQVDAGELH